MRVYVGNFMTALDMAGFSLTVCVLDDQRIAALDADTQVSPCSERDQFHMFTTTSGLIMCDWSL